MAKQQKTYTREFKVEAVQLVKGSGKPLSQIARELGISDSALSKWCKQLANQGEQAFPGSGHQTAQEWEFEQGHARGARNIPLSQLEQRLREVPTDQDILLICRSGHRGLQAAQFLQAEGWERVTNVSGGMVGWQMHHLAEG